MVFVVFVPLLIPVRLFPLVLVSLAVVPNVVPFVVPGVVLGEEEAPTELTEGRLVAEELSTRLVDRGLVLGAVPLPDLLEP